MMRKGTHPGSVTLQRLTSEVGVTSRVLQHWCDLGVLIPLQGTHKFGRGIAREFDADPRGERALARIAFRINRWGILVAFLAAITRHFRESDEGREAIDRAVSGLPVTVTFSTDGRKVTSFLVSYEPGSFKVDLEHSSAMVLNLTKCLAGPRAEDEAAANSDPRQHGEAA